MAGSRRLANAYDAARDIDRLWALLAVLNGRLCALEGKVCTLKGEPAPAAERREVTLKQAAGESGYSRSGIRKRIERGQVSARQIGGRWLVDAASLAQRPVR